MGVEPCYPGRDNSVRGAPQRIQTIHGDPSASKTQLAFRRAGFAVGHVRFSRGGSEAGAQTKRGIHSVKSAGSVGGS